MPYTMIGPLEVDYNVGYPYISFALYFVVPDKIPIVGGKRYKLGEESISLTNPSIRVPFNESPLSGYVALSLNTSQAQFSVSAEVDLDIEIYSHHWPIGPVNIQYMTPLTFVEPSWSVNPFKIDPETLRKAINAAPPNNQGSDSGAAGLRNDSATQALIREALTFAGAGYLVDQMFASARKLAVAYAQKQESAAVGAASGINSTSSRLEIPEVLVALGAGPTAGFTKALSSTNGIYFTSGGDFGIFGSLADGVGLIAELSASIVGLLYWPDGGRSAKENFDGFNYFLAADMGDFFSGGVTIYWPELTPNSPTTNSPCGIGVNAGIGAGLPVNFFAGNSTTFMGAIPPSKT